MKPIASTKRRWLALFILAIPWAQVNWGTLILKDILQGWWYAAYWLVCMTLALVAATLAGVELAASLETWRQERQRCRRNYEHLLD